MPFFRLSVPRARVLCAVSIAAFSLMPAGVFARAQEAPSTDSGPYAQPPCRSLRRLCGSPPSHSLGKPLEPRDKEHKDKQRRDRMPVTRRRGRTTIRRYFSREFRRSSLGS